MSSENEIVNQPADNGLENDTEQLQPEANDQIAPADEPAHANPEQSLLTQAEPDESLVANAGEAPQEELQDDGFSEDAEDDGWEAWIASAPEEDDDTPPSDVGEGTDSSSEVEEGMESESPAEDSTADEPEAVQEIEAQEAIPEAPTPEETASEDTASEEPIAEEATPEEPTPESPTSTETTFEEAQEIEAQEATLEEPTPEEPTPEETVSEDTASEEPISGETAVSEEVQEIEAQEATPEAPTPEETASEGPTPEEPITEEATPEEPTPEETAPEETAVLEEEAPVVAKADPPKPEKKRKPRRDKLSTQDVITYFAPCGRCGFFLSSYRAAYGRDDLETAVYESKSGWLNLTWGMQTQDIILKSFGSRIEANDLHFDGCCSECRRAFVYKGVSSEKKPPTFRIEIKPRKRQ